MKFFKIKLYYIVFTIVFFNCKTKQNKNTTNLHAKEIVSEVEKKVNFTPIICNNIKKNNFRLYESVTLSGGVIFLDRLNKQFYYAIKKENFNSLFNGYNIKCVIPARSKRLNFFDIHYSQIKEAEKVYSKLKGIGKNNDDLNKYHDFFKRGLVFILDKKQNKITLITFNPFMDNSLSKKIKDFFINYKNNFNNVFMTMGIGTNEMLIEK